MLYMLSGLRSASDWYDWIYKENLILRPAFDLAMCCKSRAVTHSIKLPIPSMECYIRENCTTERLQLLHVLRGGICRWCMDCIIAHSISALNFTRTRMKCVWRQCSLTSSRSFDRMAEKHPMSGCSKQNSFLHINSCKVWSNHPPTDWCL